MKKDFYISLMEKVLAAYSDEDIDAYISEVLENEITEHGFPRLTANIGILIANGRRCDLKERFLKMMDICCDEMPGIMLKRRGAGNDFAVKEITFCILEIEKNGVFDKEICNKWREKLSKIDPYTTYDFIASNPPERISNWAAFGAASEQVRKMAGIGDESAFIENQILSQNLSFEEMGMYRDPHEPMVYDMVTRLQLAAALFCGYDGKGADELLDNLLKSADATLFMQSVTGEIPYGGRSNQFLHNETFYAALCEFYASLFKKRGDMKKASQFKRAARLAAESVLPWLEGDTIYHVKNYFDRSEGFGCEIYAYFNKYMITAASWTYLAYYMADDSIKEAECPAEVGGFIWQSSDYFHKIILNFGGYAAEIDTAADYHYDSSGLGRIQFKGAPPAICLSVPFAKEPSYEIGGKNPSDLSICCGAEVGGKWVYGCDEGARYTLKEKIVCDDFVSVVLECKFADGAAAEEKITLSNDGVTISASGDGKVKILVPVFRFDGKNYTDVSVDEKSVSVSYKGSLCRFESDGGFCDSTLTYKNRNGRYSRFEAEGENRVSVKITIN